MKRKIITQPRNKWPKSWHNVEEPVKRNLYGHLHCWIATGETVRQSSSGNGIGDSTNLGMSVCAQFEVSVDDIRMAGIKLNLGAVWKSSMNYVNLEKPTSFLDQVCLGCTQ